jgi:hypothetical protein
MVGMAPRIPPGLKSLNSPALFGMTEVVSFHEAIYETRSNNLADTKDWAGHTVQNQVHSIFEDV